MTIFSGDLAGRLAAPLRLWPRALLADEDLAVALLDRPARERTEGRRAQGFARAQIEAGVMPGTAHGVVDHEAFGERAVIVRA